MRIFFFNSVFFIFFLLIT